MLKRLMDDATRSIYYKSPIAVQHAFTSAYGYKLRRERYTALYRESLRRYIRGEFDKAQSLIDFMHHLKTNIEVYSRIGIDEGNILDSFLDLPITTKTDLRYGLDARSHRAGKIGFSGTSGTTGTSLAVYDSERDRAERMAYLDYIKFRNDVMPFSRRASFTGQALTPHNHRNVLWRYNMAMNQMLYAANELAPGNLPHVYGSLARFRPVTLDGFPTAIHMVAKYILSNHLPVDWKVTAIFPNAEALLPHMKADIEKAFHTRVIDQYASGEGAPFLYGKADGTYQIGHETGIFEFHKLDSHIYEMVVTSLVNRATPIVRYRIGDSVEIDSDRDYLNSYCDEITIRRIIGREGDYLIGSRHNRVSSVGIARVVENIEDKVAGFQFIQEDMNHFTVNMVVEDGYNEGDERLFKERVVRRLGPDNHYHFNYVDAIPKEKNGKVRFIINRMKEAG